MHFDFNSYSAEVSGDNISIFLKNRRYAVLKVGSSIDSMDAKDIDQALSEPTVEHKGGSVTLSWTVKSSIWKSKSYKVCFEKERFWYEVEVEGQNTLKEIKYLNAGLEAHSYRNWSHFDFSQFYTPECSLLDQRYYKSNQYGCIDISMGEMNEARHMDYYANSHWIFTPPPFCYCLGYSSGPWIAAGLAPERGQYNFSRYEYFPGPNCFCFRTAYDGMTRIDGKWKAPRLVFCPAEDEYAALKSYCDTLRNWNLVDENKHEKADWWTKPIFCGWGEQNVQMEKSNPEKRNTQEWSTQKMYDMFLDLIREKQLKPGTLVIDDKWQKHYGTCDVDTAKWPDLRKWIDDRHAEGYKVLLWFGACDGEGLPEDELMQNPDGTYKWVDPTSPAYQQRMKEIMHRLISSDPGCYNADGIKYDWTSFFPPAEGYKVHGDNWGIELLKILTKNLYDAAKEAKSDAFFITHTANPYFSECTDVIRLNDMHWSNREIVSLMQNRAKIGHIACPHALIDCDNSSAPTRTEWLEYMKVQPEIGIPSLYFLTGVDGTLEDITEEDWKEIADIWR